MPLCSTYLFSRISTKKSKQRTLLQIFWILACFSLAIYGHEIAGRSTNYIRNLRHGPLQAPLQPATKRVSDSESDITAFVNELSPQLSSEASITVIGSDDFDELTVRWTAWAAPKFQATVQVYTEEDISNTVILMILIKYENLQLSVDLRLLFQTNSNCLGWQSLAVMEAFVRSAS